MPVVSIEDAATLWSVNRLADGFEMDRATVKRRLLAAGIQPQGETPNGYPAYRLKVVAGYLIDALPGRDADPERLPPRDRLDWYKGELERLKLAQLQGALVPAAEVEAEFSTIVKTTVTALSTLADALERDALLTPAQYERVEQVVNQWRQSLYDCLAEDSPIEEMA